ncbi:hypothetical protein XENOCAPTIV_018851 [Xenoophorus captivus]|uniref:Uncharacterized protein n=1 Tax=Xenoophorus captivus TaxID=1517983 RepID=A0ABV0R138_9TELE
MGGTSSQYRSRRHAGDLQFSKHTSSSLPARRVIWMRPGHEWSELADLQGCMASALISHNNSPHYPMRKMLLCERLSFM